MRVTTQSGSVYEVDTTKKQIRRLNGVGDPSPRMGKDGQWRPYREVYGNEVGKSLTIIWGMDTELLPETKDDIAEGGGCAIPTTITSPIVSIETKID
ncbi:MAG TPA: hypothetical protein VII94_03410 [Candidatus Saccharimonadales bacterium]